MNCSTHTLKFVSLLTIAALLLVGCGSQPSPLVAVLEGISIAADVSAPVVAVLSPAAAGFISLVPGVVTAALDIVEGTAPLSAASTVATQLQTVWAQGNAMLPNLPVTDKTVVTGILAALKAGIDLYQQQYPPAATASLGVSLIGHGYAMGFVDSPSPTTAKVKKLGKADKASVARSRGHLAALKAKLAAK